jgi:unsaturated rhamnogalacturonyl hydrolase
MKITLKLSIVLILTLIMGNSVQSIAQSGKEVADLKNWPKGFSPIEVGKRVAFHFTDSPHFNYFRPTPPSQIVYPETCTWYGALTFAKLSHDDELITRLTKRFDPLFREESSLIPVPNHVDFTVFGAVPLEMYIIKKERRYLEIGQSMADKQWDAPSGPKINEAAKRYFEMGYSPQTRLWIDDMYMITAVQIQAYRATGDRKYSDRAAKEMVMYLDSLQMPNGLFYHAPDVPFYWGRGNGWMAAGMAELLSSLPKDNPDRPRIMEGYKKMMTTLLKYQADNGTWRQLIDEPTAWTETSGTGMFAFAMITGVKNGWLDKQVYGAAARKAWLGLVSYIDNNNDVREVCEGTNKKNDKQYYFDRKRNVGDLHGQAPVLWCASALLR